MTYPTLTRVNAVRIANELLKLEVDSRVSASLVQDNLISEKLGEFDANQLRSDSDAVSKKWNDLVNSVKKVTKDDLVQFEVKIAPEIFTAINKVSLDCREDEDFWRYLALYPFRWYSIAREPELKPQDYGGLKETVDVDKDGNEVMKISNSNMVNQLIYRTYLIGKAMEDASDKDDPFRRSSAIPRGGPLTDIWQSHIIRVTIGRIGLIRHAFIDRVKVEPDTDSRMLGFARNLASRITRLKNNVALDSHSKSEIDAVIDEIAKDI
jgi:hypothetical protein